MRCTIAAITITVRDDLLPRVQDAFATVYNHNPATDGPKTQFARRKVIEYVRSIVQSYEVRIAAEAAAQAASDAVINDMQGIT